MKSEYKKLVADTLDFIKDEGIEPPKKEMKKKATPKKQVKAESFPPSPSSATTLVDKIQKNLPHINLKSDIPISKSVAIVMGDKQDLVFLKNLAKAIQEKLCPVKLFDKKTTGLSSFTLVLSQVEPSGDRTIFLKSGAFYKNSTEEKKKLWLQICQKLSLKSS